MGEALISSRSGSSAFKDYKLKTEIITSNTIYTVPNAKNQEFSVLLFGGGGAAYFNGTTTENNISQGIGGPGGCMNKDTLILNEGESFEIIIGDGGEPAGINIGKGTAGGTTFFGNYLSAAGGSHISSATNPNNIYGGSTGGSYGLSPGIALMFGSGGTYNNNGGNAGIYGGSGGVYRKNNNHKVGNSGTYGGNGGTNVTTAQNGTNTSSWTNIESKFRGKGTAGSGNYAGGGGCGGCGGHGATGSTNNGCGGGGGYGANGGNGLYNRSAGGGGGYGKAGYGGDGYNGCCGGCGAYGHGASYTECSTFGGGGSASHNPAFRGGAAGICIIQYYSCE